MRLVLRFRGIRLRVIKGILISNSKLDRVKVVDIIVGISTNRDFLGVPPINSS